MPVPPKGARVLVPLGARIVTGCVVGAAGELPAGTRLRDVATVLDATPFLPRTIVDLALWVGDYYASGPGDALAIAMPPAARRGTAASFRTVSVVRLTPAGQNGGEVTGPKQRQLLDRLRASAAPVSLRRLLADGFSRATVRGLVARALVELREEISLRDPFGGEHSGGGDWTIKSVTPADRALTDEQQAAIDRLSASAATKTFHTTLLHGVTGSGKTEVYLRLARLIVDAGRRVLILVPEIALTPALVGIFRARFGERVAIQHSGLSAGERHDQWHRIRQGDIDVVVGTRSAVFAPLEQLGLIIVDEEHEPSYKQEESPRYHGRDVAVMRGRMEDALVVLGSATPALESMTNAREGRYGLITLKRRVLDRPLAAVRVVDMRAEFATRGAEVTLSEPLIEGIAHRLERGEQSIVLLNRRGFATVIFCRQCGATSDCPKCSVTLTFHRAAKRLQCHYCNHSTTVPPRCAACGGEFLSQSGFGTERIEADLRERFPSARLARLDRDTVRRRGGATTVLASVGRGEVDVLVGTQMIAKGHDFPAVTLVGVISADVGLGRADFRASERTFQLLTQVVGRAGRGVVTGEAIIQTLYPEHYAVRTASAQDYDTFFAREMEFRTAMQYPPSTALINVIVKGRTIDVAMRDAVELAGRVRQPGMPGRVIGPAPAAMAKINDEYRAQFFIKGARNRGVRRALMAALDARPDLRKRTILDVDPMSVT
jgi:primosomal protein N' (replication factor Y)